MTKVKIVDINTDPQTTIPNNSVKFDKYCVRQDKTELACLMLHDSITVYEFMSLDCRSYKPKFTKIANFKHNCNEKLIKRTGLIRFLLAMDNMTNT
jgi:hypothetical protein